MIFKKYSQGTILVVTVLNELNQCFQSTLHRLRHMIYRSIQIVMEMVNVQYELWVVTKRISFLQFSFMGKKTVCVSALSLRALYTTAHTLWHLNLSSFFSKANSFIKIKALAVCGRDWMCVRHSTCYLLLFFFVKRSMQLLFVPTTLYLVLKNSAVWWVDFNFAYN